MSAILTDEAHSGKDVCISSCGSYENRSPLLAQMAMEMLKAPLDLAFGNERLALSSTPNLPMPNSNIARS